MLEYKLGSGWKPLCEFLGKNVPQDVDFSRVNDAETLSKGVNQAAMGDNMEAAKMVLLQWVTPVAAAGLGLYAYRE